MFLDEPISTEEKSSIPKSADRSWSMWLVVAVISFISGSAGALVMQTYLSDGSFEQLAPALNLRPQVVQEESVTTEVVKKVSPSVVSIIISKDISQLYNQTGIFPFDLFNFPFGFNITPQPAPEGKREVGGGTGFVINQQAGLILTNKHVVEDNTAEYTVLTGEGERLAAQVVALDPLSDMALVKVETNKLPQVTLGDSDQVQIGETVIAIGNALGEYRNTVTKGVISGIGRNIMANSGQGAPESLENLFQTDAAINRGNSGGPLVNLGGEVIGINTAVDQQGQLIGFTIPINEAKRMILSFEKFGKIVRPYLGVRYTLITPEYARANNLPVDYGALIVKSDNTTQSVLPDSPADKAGIKPGDIILEVNGQKVDTGHSLARLLGQFNPGDGVRLKILRDSKNIELNATLEEYKD